MHGIIFSELNKYVDDKLGPHKWPALLRAAGLDGRTYLPTRDYPDADATALVMSASQMTGLAAPVILEDFGAYMVSDLLRLYASVIDPAWKTLDVIEHTENVIHRVVRLRDPSAKPPELQCTRTSDREVKIVYRSPRRLCNVAKGIVRGLSNHFGEEVLIREVTCMLDGASECEIVASLSG